METLLQEFRDNLIYLDGGIDYCDEIIDGEIIFMTWIKRDTIIGDGLFGVDLQDIISDMEIEFEDILRDKKDVYPTQPILRLEKNGSITEFFPEDLGYILRCDAEIISEILPYEIIKVRVWWGLK